MLAYFFFFMKNNNFLKYNFGEKSGIALHLFSARRYRRHWYLLPHPLCGALFWLKSTKKTQLHTVYLVGKGRTSWCLCSPGDTRGSGPPHTENQQSDARRAVCSSQTWMKHTRAGMVRGLDRKFWLMKEQVPLYDAGFHHL